MYADKKIFFGYICNWDSLYDCGFLINQNSLQNFYRKSNRITESPKPWQNFIVVISIGNPNNRCRYFVVYGIQYYKHIANECRIKISTNSTLKLMVCKRYTRSMIDFHDNFTCFESNKNVLVLKSKLNRAIGM